METKTELSKQGRRMERKKRKMEALLRLDASHQTEKQMTDHEKMICDLEANMLEENTPGMKRRLSGDYDDPDESQQDLNAAYKEFMKKRAKMQALPIQIAVDQNYLSYKRRRNLLYNENAKSLETPVCIHPSSIQALLMYCLLGRSSLYRPRWCSVQHVSSVNQLVLAVIDVSHMDTSISMPSTWRNLNAIFPANQVIAVKSPKLFSTSIDDDLFMVPLTPIEIATSTSSDSEAYHEQMAPIPNSAQSMCILRALGDALFRPTTQQNWEISTELLVFGVYLSLGLCPDVWENLLQTHTDRNYSSHRYSFLAKDHSLAIAVMNVELKSPFKNEKQLRKCFYYRLLLNPLKDLSLYDTDKSYKETNEPDLIVEIDPLTHRDMFSRTLLLLSVTELIEEGFPLPCQSINASDNSGFVFSKANYSRVTASSPIFAVDCEMVTTCTNSLELASICMVNEKMEVIYSSLVKPTNTITDYLTRFSGMTKKLLSPVTKRLEDVQNELRELLPTDAILGGHSLNSDLAALRMYHPYVIDTSVIYNLKGMPHSKTGLRKLAEYFLRKEIQGGSDGHCPEEDARTTMELILLKLQIGYSFGNVLADGLTATPQRFFRKKFKAPRVDKKSEPNEKKKPIETQTFSFVEDKLESIDGHSTSSESTPAERTADTQDKGDTQNGAETQNESRIPDKSDSQSKAVIQNLTDTQNVTVTQNEADVQTEAGTHEKAANGPTVASPSACANTIEPMNAFNRRTIPQLESSLFDLLANHKKTVSVSCTCDKVPVNAPSDLISVKNHNKSINKSALKAVRSGTNLVYVHYEEPKSHSDPSSADQLKRLDSYLKDIWDAMTPDTVFMVLETGTVAQHGAFRFCVKPRQAEESNILPSEDEITDPYELMYGIQ